MSWLHWQGVADFVALSVALYLLLRWAKQARALRVVGLLVGLQAASRILRHLDLTITSWILDIGTLLVALMLIFFFQSELRHAFLRLDALVRLGLAPARTLGTGNRAVAEAAFALASQRLGALIVIARKERLEEFLSGGIQIGAEISPEILRAIFQKQSPVHDGAVVIEAGRIARAGAVLPLTQRADVPPYYGTRHRAAMGLAERSDAVVVVVSEERGQVTVMHDMRSIPVESPEELAGLLGALLVHRAVSWRRRLREWLLSELRLKAAAVALAALIWGLTSSGPGATVRILSVPIEFSGVPSGMEIATQSATRLEVQLRGASWLMNSVGLSGVVAKFDLSKAGKGQLILKVGTDSLNLPPGVVVERVRPEWITVSLVDRASPPPAASPVR
jgi:diadenylate cyclase